jgi:hypothetical protein
MDARRNGISTAELASEASTLLGGLGILSVALFPFAVPALVLGFVLVLPLIVLVPPVLAIWLLVRGVARLLRRTRSRPAADQAEPLRKPRPVVGSYS